MFVLGILSSLAPEYEIKSNREAGYGRADLMLIPKDIARLGIIYEEELLSRGIKNILKLAIVFKGKEVVVKES